MLSPCIKALIETQIRFTIGFYWCSSTMHLLQIFLAIFQLGHALSLDESCSENDVHICGTCTNVECEMGKDNMIGSFSSVMSSEECQEWCTRRNDYMNDCRYITYFDNEGLPIQNMCYIFSSCGKKSECTNCVSETSDCLCSSSNMGKIESTNLLKDIADILSEEECRQKCRDNSNVNSTPTLLKALNVFF